MNGSEPLPISNGLKDPDGKPTSSGFARFIPFLCTLAIVGAVAYSLVAPPLTAPGLDEHAGARAVIEGVVIEDPDVRETSSRLTLAVDTVNGVRAPGRIGEVIVIAGKYAPVSYGDRLRVNGILKAPKSFETENGRTFDYPKYLRAQGVSYQISFADIAVVGHEEGNPIIQALFSVKHALQRGLVRALPEPESALAGGILLGEKQSLGGHITEAFRRAGVIHIVVLSGYNVSIVIAAVLFIALRVLPRTAALVLAGSAIILFAIMTGASETAVRASAMAAIVLLAKGLNRPADALRILLIVAALMALWNPFIVLYNLSYQLSILATLGLILFSNPIEQRIGFVPETLGLRQILAATIATQVTVAPLLILSMGQFSVISLIANPVVLPAVGLAMLFSFLAGTLASFSVTLALPFSFAAYLFLHYIIAVSVWFGSLPFASISIPLAWQWFALGFLALVYTAVFRFALRRNALPQPSRSNS